MDSSVFASGFQKETSEPLSAVAHAKKVHQGPTVVVRCTYRHEVVRLKQAQGFAKRLTDPCSPQPCADCVYLLPLKLRNSQLFPDGQRNGDSFVAFCIDKKWGRKNEPVRSGTFGQANAKAYAARKLWCHWRDACRNVFSWRCHRRRRVSAPK